MSDAPKRPTNRAECRGGCRPCPWYSCRYHLGLDITKRGTVKVVIDPETLDSYKGDTCALDVADRGSHSLEAIGDAMHVCRERIRQLEKPVLEALAKTLTDPGTALTGDASEAVHEAIARTRSLAEHAGALEQVGDLGAFYDRTAA